MKKALLNKREQQLIQEACGATEPSDLMKSKTYIDVGRWWRFNPLWLCFLKKEVIVMALGRRRYIEKVSFKDIKDSYYCHTTGELVFEPIEKLTFKRFKLSPLNALRALHAIGIDITKISNHQQEIK
jgi:hypothetical protein